VDRSRGLATAFQYFEEDRNGTLEVGMLADLVTLSADPLVGDPMKMSDIFIFVIFSQVRERTGVGPADEPEHLPPQVG
jgi:cytosine/adenosine deaminase-related metal-dependent hydrolase